MPKDFVLDPIAQEIVEGLKQALDGAVVVLFDEHEQQEHVALLKKGFALRRRPLKVPHDRCHVAVAVNGRWRLAVWALTETQLHPDAAALVTWAAQKLAHRLPRRREVLPSPPTGGSSGPSGAAELGIPLWWARRTRD